jgi:hypothetical protein
LFVTDPEYRPRIVMALEATKGEGTENDILNSIFRCLDRKGNIEYLELCHEGCGGLHSKENPDHCLQV